ncbi:MAG: aspartate kinase, partial [bacterium]
MSFYVQKYGGSSVANPDKMKNAASRIVDTAEDGNQVLAVVSALGDTTDELIDLAREVSGTHPKREMDLLMSTGEVMSSALLAMAIEDLGHPAVALTAHQMGIKTDVAHTKARILNIDGQRIWDELDQDKIVVAAGFQGVTEDRDITTLGRGGSDTTAVALAAVLEADECEIYSDVDGVFTADPRRVDSAHKIDRVNYEEMLELASLGTEVLQVRAVEFAWKYGVKIHVRSSFHEEPGTIITSGGDDMEEVDVRAVTADIDQSRISVIDVPDKPGIAGEIFGSLSEQNINVDMIIQSSAARKEAENDISFTISRDDFEDALDAIEEVLSGVGGEGITTDDDIAKVSVVGTGMRNHPGVAKKYARAEGDNWVDIDKTIEAWQREDHRYDPDEWHEWESIPEEEFDVNGVSHPNLREYVLERAIKLELADDVVGTFTEDGDRIGNIRRTARRFVEANGTAARNELRGELVSQVYTQWNQLGTPAYYCDFSNTFDVGPAPLENTWVKQLKGWFDSLYQRFKQKLRELSNRIGLTELETRSAVPETIPLPSVSGVRLSKVFSVGPEDISSSSSAIPAGLVERADAYDRYYDKLYSNTTERAATPRIKKANSYPELLENRETNQSDTYVKQFGTNAADAIVIGDTAQSILQAGSDVSSLLGSLEAISSAVEPTTAGVLAGVGKSILQVPEYHAETGDILEPEIKGRDDTTYGDVWRFPYGDDHIRMNRLKYVTRESIMETL